MTKTFLAALIMGAFAALPAKAEVLTQTCNYSDPYGENAVNCDQHIETSFVSAGVGTFYGLKLTAPATHCSRVSYYVNRPDLFFYGETEMLAPGESGVVNLGADFLSGDQRVDIGVIGEIGGCNTGALSGWGVDVEAVVIPQ